MAAPRKTRYYTYKRDVPKPKPGQKIDFRKGKGYFLTPVPPRKPEAVPPGHGPNLPPSMFSGRGVFTTSDTTTAFGYNCDWSAIQMDPEGDHEVEHGFPGRVRWWMARPTEVLAREAAKQGIPFIAQAESNKELLTALALGPDVKDIPHALIGNPQTWDTQARQEAVDQGWDLILEWYWNNTPSYTSPNADNYPLFRNVCFGTFNSETVPGRRVSVAQYREVWKGSFSIWDTENADGGDRIGFNAP